MRLQRRVVYEELSPEVGSCHVKHETPTEVKVQSIADLDPKPSSAPTPSAMPTTSLRFAAGRAHRAGANLGPTNAAKEEAGGASRGGNDLHGPKEDQ